jgi:hypothetical protein
MTWRLDWLRSLYRQRRFAPHRYQLHQGEGLPASRWFAVTFIDPRKGGEGYRLVTASNRLERQIF